MTIHYKITFALQRYNILMLRLYAITPLTIYKFNIRICEMRQVEKVPN